jgi:hypothetical protein
VIAAADEVAQACGLVSLGFLYVFKLALHADALVLDFGEALGGRGLGSTNRSALLALELLGNVLLLAGQLGTKLGVLHCSDFDCVLAAALVLALLLLCGEAGGLLVGSLGLQAGGLGLLCALLGVNQKKGVKKRTKAIGENKSRGF